MTERLQVGIGGFERDGIPSSVLVLVVAVAEQGVVEVVGLEAIFPGVCNSLFDGFGGGVGDPHPLQTFVGADDEGTLEHGYSFHCLGSSCVVRLGTGKSTVPFVPNTGGGYRTGPGTACS